MFERPKGSSPATSKETYSIVTLHILRDKKSVWLNSLIPREKMAQAYDFALDKIGMEIMSYQVCKFELLIVNFFFLFIIYTWPRSSCRFGWTTSISLKECKWIFCLFAWFLFQPAFKNLSNSFLFVCLLKVRPWAHMPRIRESLLLGESTKGDVWTQWLTLNSCGETIANMKRQEITCFLHLSTLESDWSVLHEQRLILL